MKRTLVASIQAEFLIASEADCALTLKQAINAWDHDYDVEAFFLHIIATDLRLYSYNI